jgi:hypothetical protein
MIDPPATPSPAFDTPEISRLLFYPRREAEAAGGSAGGRLAIPVAEGVVLGARLHDAGKQAPVIVFFHGNGEIVSDYDETGNLYRRRGINFLPVDYRGYGLSSGVPTLSAIMADALAAFDYLRRWLENQGWTGPFLVMGRSLGSAPALEVAYHRQDSIAGLIIESGFARILPLLRLLGYSDPSLNEAEGPGNLEKIRQVKKPTLVIHAGADRIIDLSEGQALYRASGAAEKFFLEVPAAGHNDIFLRGMPAYMQAIDNMMQIVRKPIR